MMRPIFCGNFEFESRPSDLERLFKRYGKVDRVDMKSGFAFIYMEDERDAEYAIRALDRTEFGRKGRRLRVEWTKHERGGGGGGGAGAGGGRKPISSKRSANLPSKTLFVINFPFDTKTRDLERHFDPYGKILNVRIRRNFAFVQYESQEDATKALDATNMSKLLGREISVEYASRDDDERRNGGINSERRGRDRSPDRRRRSPSPYKRQRGSPDYGAGSSPAAYRRDRGSPVYGNGSSRSPRRVDRGSPEYNRTRSISPRRDVRASPEYRGRGRSRSRSPRGGDRSPRGGERNGNGHGRRPSLSPDEREEGAILDDDQDYRSPVRKPSSRDSMSPVRKPSSRDSMSPVRKPNSRDSMSPVRKPSSRDSMSPVRRPSSRDHSMSPVRKPSCRDSLSPVRRPSSRDMTGVEDGSPMDDRYRSRSPPARERSRS